MDFKHFSHLHPLVFHPTPPPPTENIHCSGCKTPAPGSIYACWQCRYFLHDQCCRAARSVNHPSHPLHPLTLVPFPTYESNTFICNTCNHSGNGFSYSCSECDFDLHVHCASLPPANAAGFSGHPPHMPQNINPVYPPPMQSGPFPAYPPHV